jgi:hypothetical protein
LESHFCKIENKKIQTSQTKFPESKYPAGHLQEPEEMALKVEAMQVKQFELKLPLQVSQD